MGKKWLFPAAAVLCVVSAALSLGFGAAKLSPGDLVSGTIFWHVRLPRTAACCLSGAALAAAGCILQRVLGNHLASPGIIGVNAGAGLAVSVCCAAGVLWGWAIALAAFGGALAAVLAVAALARKTGASRTTVILAGVAMNSILSGFRDAVTTLVPEAAMLSGEFRVGGFSAVAAVRLIPAGILIAAALVLALTMTNELEVLALGEDTAQALGMPVKRMRNLFLLLAALLAGASVSFAGLLGFVGLLVPHASRRLAGTDTAMVLPLSALLGAGFLTLCDTAARVIFAPYELPVGILMSVIGGPFFLILLLREKGGRRSA